ncbi:uncharacterized protein LOC129747829 [Uranotaenia lowii]|uniref:uncharacterized protein LOC129747829 n=1 Tax=Uranotaenia lowii TaxID=190385 RepID=UPI0024798ECA|nr:uncharacterized protein LOC129747829 [Uranotaenia lowii]
MAKFKRKLPKPVNKPTATIDDNDSGSDYEVERVLKPSQPVKTVQEEFPLPKKLRQQVVHPKHLDPNEEQDSSSEEESSEDDDDGRGLPTLTKAQISEILKTIKNNKRLVLNVSNVNFSTAKEEIEEHFRQAGRVRGVRIPKRRASGFAFVEMLDPDGFQRAFLLDNSFLDGRQIRVRLSESGHKKSHNKILELERKNAEIRKMRKKNRVKPEATKVSLAPEMPQTSKVVERDPILDKPKTKPPTKKQIKEHNKRVSMKAKFRNWEKKGIKV